LDAFGPIPLKYRGILSFGFVEEVRKRPYFFNRQPTFSTEFFELRRAELFDFFWVSCPQAQPFNRL
jgi:hypothetical protein